MVASYTKVIDIVCLHSHKHICMCVGGSMCYDATKLQAIVVLDLILGPGNRRKILHYISL